MDRFVETRDRTLVEALRGPLERWRASKDSLQPLIQASPALLEIEPLSQALSTVADIGILALDVILAGTAPDAAWAKDSLKALEQAKKPKAHAELAIVSAVAKLVRTTVGK